MHQDLPRIKTLLGRYPNTLALREERLKPTLFEFDFDPVKTPNRAFKRAVRGAEFQVAELALVTFLQAKAYGKPLSLMPAVVGAGRFQHHCLVYNAEQAPLKVGQLRGKRIGIRAHAQTTVTWVRGVLHDDYGVALDDVQWVTFEDGHLAEFPDPPNFIRAPEGSSAAQMLLAGELDAAIIGTDLPDDPRLQPVLPDPHVAAAAWGKRNRLVPINHMMAIHTDLMQGRPDIVREIYNVLQESKRLAPTVQTMSEQQLAGQAGHGLQAVHRAKDVDLGGVDLTPFGVEANRGALEVLIRNSYDQGLIPRAFSVDDLFEDFNRLW
jgi:4,5-dihydroxyphthalate decarboxylase